MLWDDVTSTGLLNSDGLTIASIATAIGTNILAVISLVRKRIAVSTGFVEDVSRYD